MLWAAFALGLTAAPVFAQQTTTPKVAPVDDAAVRADRLRQQPERVEARTGRAGLLQRFTSEQEELAKGLNFPLLMPKSLLEANRRNQLDAPLSLVVAGDDYSSEAKSAPRTYLVQGTRIVFEVPSGVAPAVQSAVGDVYVEGTIYGIEASFERYGAMYSIAIFCADPEGDPECAEEGKVRALADEMVFAITEN